MHVTFKGKPVELEGNQLHSGDLIPDFTAVKNDLSTFRFSSITGGKLIVAVPSIDTSVCDMEVRRFNTEAANIPGISVITISMDLPFAQNRWCGAAGIDKLTTISDHKEHDFGHKTGTYIPELGLLARTVYVVDSDNVIRYAEYVPEIASHPNYDAALAAAKSLL